MARQKNLTLLKPTDLDPALTLVGLRDRLSDIIAEHDRKGWGERNYVPVVLQVRTRTGTDIRNQYLPVHCVSTALTSIAVDDGREKAPDEAAPSCKVICMKCDVEKPMGPSKGTLQNFHRQMEAYNRLADGRYEMAQVLDAHDGPRLAVFAARDLVDADALLGIRPLDDDQWWLVTTQFSPHRLARSLRAGDFDIRCFFDSAALLLPWDSVTKKVGQPLPRHGFDESLLPPRGDKLTDRKQKVLPISEKSLLNKKEYAEGCHALYRPDVGPADLRGREPLGGSGPATAPVIRSLTRDAPSPGEDAVHLAADTCLECAQPIRYHAGSRRWNHINALDDERPHQEGRRRPKGWLDPWHRGPGISGHVVEHHEKTWYAGAPLEGNQEAATLALMELRQAVIDKAEVPIPEEVREIVWPSKSGWAGQIGLKWDGARAILRSPLDVSSTSAEALLRAIDICLGRRPAPLSIQRLCTMLAFEPPIFQVTDVYCRLNGQPRLALFRPIAARSWHLEGVPLLLGYHQGGYRWLLAPIKLLALEKLQTGELPLRRPFETGWLLLQDLNPDPGSRELPLKVRTCEVERLPPARTWLSPGNA